MSCSRYWLALLCALPLALLGPAASFAQQPAELVVSLRDARGHALAADISVRAPAGGPVLAHATTDASGVATLRGLPASEARVLVAGRMPDGTALRQPGDDAGGLRVWLAAGATRLDLRAEADGSVVPDPATMVVPEGLAEQPGAAASTPAAAAAPTPAAGAPTHAREMALGWLLAAAFGLALLVVLVARRRV